jgi:hypothetical protein
MRNDNNRSFWMKNYFVLAGAAGLFAGYMTQSTKLSMLRAARSLHLPQPYRESISLLPFVSVDDGSIGSQFSLFHPFLCFEPERV